MIWAHPALMKEVLQEISIRKSVQVCLHAMKTASLSEHCVFVGHDEEIISEAAAAAVWSSIHYFFLRGSCRSLLGEMQESFFI